MGLQWKKLLVMLAIPLGVGALSSLLSGSAQGFRQLDAPPLTPPGWVFPVVWTALYILMGIGSYRVLVSGSPREDVGRALRVYFVQLAVNFLWPLVFFRWELRLTAFWILIGLWVLVLVTMVRFYRLDERAGDCILPYLLWVTFAGYLNLGFFLEN